MTETLTLTECKDRIKDLTDKIMAKQIEINSFAADLESLSESTPDPTAAVSDRLAFSENKSNQARQIEAAKNLAERELLTLNSRRSQIKAVGDRLDALMTLGRAVGDFMKARAELQSSWDEIRAAICDCRSVGDMNFPFKLELNDLVKKYGLIELQEIDAIYSIKRPED